MSELMPLFLNLAGRDVVLVGAGRVAAGKLRQLLAAGARVRVVAPSVAPEIEEAGVDVVRRGFEPCDLDGAWLVVAAAPPDVNREVAAAAESRRVFVNAVDDPANASAFLTGVVRRSGMTLAISTKGEAPALTALVREAIDALLPQDLNDWVAEARRQRKIWRSSRVPMESRKPRLLQALNSLYEGSGLRAQGSGHEPEAVSHEPAGAGRAARLGYVSLVGAGPGDPALLTRKAIARLRAADLVLYDALIDERTLRYARKAQRFFVGKRAGRHALSQETVHTVMIRAARRGRHVVRLKGGDPFVFGRGGEEMQALERAGIQFDVVPGVTSALAGPALAGIPVTHRGLSSAFLVVSGHDEALFGASLGRLQPNRVTVVVLMGLGRSAVLARALLDGGWRQTTPAAIIVSASLPEQQVWRGTLAELAADKVDMGTSGPGTIVLGDVVALAAGASAEFERHHASNR
ncbi:MAG: uroporphyrinogen-III C-methyltransferase [Vicinamibacterales bacterium]